ncbi:MAG: DUF362 domain-containing protein [Elusimicrobia bacterium]|nr:DUF362 domain-containing protein [Elusimicrobiota bacterium]
MPKTIVSAYHCTDYSKDNIYDIVEKIVKSFGNLFEIIKPKSKVLLKLNLLSAYTPDQAITTHPEIVRAVINIVRKAGAIPVLGDSPGNLVNGIEHVWEKTGMLQLAKEENVELVNFEACGCVEVSIQHPTIKQIYITKAVTDCDAIINLPKLKTHTFMGFTCGVKNFYGVVPGARKVEYHKLSPTPKEFSYLLSEIYRMIREKLLFTIVDGVWGLEGNGPSLSGQKRKYNIIAGSQDTVMLDSFILNRLGINSKNNLLLKPLKEKKLGNTDLENMIYIGDSVSSFNFTKTKLPVTKFLNLLPSWIARFVTKYFGWLFWVKPHIIEKKCVGCLQCMKSCPAKAIEKDKKSLKPVIRKDKCIGCFCCHELCLHKAIEIRESFIASLFIKNEKK